jgi:hypothetical protein
VPLLSIPSSSSAAKGQHLGKAVEAIKQASIVHQRLMNNNLAKEHSAERKAAEGCAMLDSIIIQKVCSSQVLRAMMFSISDCNQKCQHSSSPEEEQEVIDIDTRTQSTKDRAAINVDLATIDVDLATIDIDLATIDIDLATIDIDLAIHDLDLATHNLDLAMLEVDLATLYADLTILQMDEGSLVQSIEGLAIPHTVAMIDNAID